MENIGVAVLLLCNLTPTCTHCPPLRKLPSSCCTAIFPIGRPLIMSIIQLIQCMRGVCCNELVSVQGCKRLPVRTAESQRLQLSPPRIHCSPKVVSRTRTLEKKKCCTSGPVQSILPLPHDAMFCFFAWKWSDADVIIQQRVEESFQLSAHAPRLSVAPKLILTQQPDVPMSPMQPAQRIDAT